MRRNCSLVTVVTVQRWLHGLRPDTADRQGYRQHAASLLLPCLLHSYVDCESGSPWRRPGAPKVLYNLGYPADAGLLSLNLKFSISFHVFGFYNYFGFGLMKQNSDVIYVLIVEK